MRRSVGRGIECVDHARSEERVVPDAALTTLALATSPALGFDAGVAPDDAAVGKRTCFEFAVAGRGERVHFLGKRARIRSLIRRRSASRASRPAAVSG